MRLSVVALFAAALLVTAACGKDETPRPPRSANPKPSQPEPEPEPAPLPVEAPEAPSGSGRPIEIVLESTPPGAAVSVDGLAIGTTPTLWVGSHDGRTHEFVFKLAGHSDSIYRFIPIQNGVVHGTLMPAPAKTGQRKSNR
jgi:hypothetical protein